MQEELKRTNVTRYIVISSICIILGSFILITSIRSEVFQPNIFSIGLVLVGAALVIFFLLVFKDPMRFIKNYLLKHPEYKMEDLDIEFKNSQKFGPRVWVGQRWTIFLNPYGAPEIIENEKIVWAYQHNVRVNGIERKFLYAYDTNIMLAKIPMDDINLEALLKLYHIKYGVIVGYNEQYNNMLYSNFNLLLNMRYRN